MTDNILEAATHAVNRRSFLKNAGGATAALAAMAAAPQLLHAQTPTYTASLDTPAEIFTAALIAEDLAITFYYNGLRGRVIQDANLAGPGGSAHIITPSGSESNVAYLRAALSEEVAHAKLFRSLLYGSSAPSTKDPVQTFYFPTGTFDTLTPFINMLQTLEQAFIAAYMCAIREFSALAAAGKPATVNGVTYQVGDFIYFAYVSASILGIESEHRALGRAISPTLIPANDYNYEAANNIVSVYNGPRSAAGALMPFLSAGSGKVAYSYQAAYSGAPAEDYPNIQLGIPSEI